MSALSPSIERCREFASAVEAVNLIEDVIKVVRE
jgi:hypothetical protein